jgi:hypothetical protein
VDDRLKRIMKSIHTRPAWTGVERYGTPGNYVNGANIAGFLKVANAMMDQGFIVISVPAIAWWLSLSLVKALAMDFSFTLFYLGYTYVYNWIYDRVFPYPELEPE